MDIRFIKNLLYAIVSVLLGTAAVLAFTGCALQPQFDKQRVIELATPEARAAIARQQVIVGMTAPEVVAAWGWPEYTRDNNTAHGNYSMWVYERNLADAGLGGLLMSAYIAQHRGGSARSQVVTTRYVHLKNNKVIAINR